MEILIVAKTRMTGPFCCVGGLELKTNRSVRLLQSNGQNMPENFPVEVGEVWEMEYTPRPNPRPPHVEDVLVTKFQYLRRQPNLRAFLQPRVQVWRGGPEQLFGGKLCATPSGSGYVCAKAGLPDRSTGYWMPDRTLEKVEQNGRIRYLYPTAQGIRSFPFVGLAKPVERLLAGTLLRVSLARWWRPEADPDAEERCYLQLSGWYLE